MCTSDIYLFGDGVKAGCGLNGADPKRSCPKLFSLLFNVVRLAALGGGATKIIYKNFLAAQSANLQNCLLQNYII